MLTYDRYDRYDREKCNFLYRKLFTPNLNVFLYTKVVYISVISVIHNNKRIRKVLFILIDHHFWGVKIYFIINFLYLCKKNNDKT